MNELVLNDHGRAVTNSVLVAKTFGKEHKHVLEAIRGLIKGSAEISAHPVFVESTYVNEQNNQIYPMFVMDRDGFTLLAMGFSGKKALDFKIAYINAFNQMEKQIRSNMVALPNFSNPAEAARAWAEQYEQRQIEAKRADEAEQQVLELTNEIEQNAPKVVFADAIVGSKTNILVRDLAKLIQQNGYNIGEIRLYQWLRDNKYLTLNNRPMQRYMEQGLFFVSEGTHSENGILKSHFTTKVTPKGQQYFINLFINNDRVLWGQS